MKFVKEYIITVDETKPDIMGSVPLMEPPKELIRCKNCKRRLECDYWLENGDNWFCADGERR